jgi:DUF4097 and DUF4098 domain-containing protein YvlB
MTMRTDRRLALSAGVALALLFVLGSAIQVAGWTVGSVEHRAHRVIPGPVGTLTIEARSGDVRLVPSATDQVVIDSRASGTLHTPKLEVRPEGARVRVSGGCPEFTFGHCSAEIVVAVPARTAVHVEAGSGDVDADGVASDVVVRSASGDVVAQGLRGGSAELETASGDIDASGVRTRSLIAQTGSGDVTVQLFSAPQSVDARTDSGDVAVLVPPGDERYRVDAETDSGDRNVGVDDTVRAPRTLRAHTNSGVVVVDYGD